MSFFKRLTHRAKELDSLLCVGLDPHRDDLPEPTVDSVIDFCRRLIVATESIAVAYKPNIAFFEEYGPAGITVLQQVIASVPDGAPVILDAKRGDIASTGEAYARAVFDVLGADAVTINPYLGRDSIEPFLKDPERGVFLLCKTSNPGAADLQDLLVDKNMLVAEQGYGCYLYERVAHYAHEWNTQDNLGLVVGATHPEALRRVRRYAPDLWILAPGVGMQGGNLVTSLQAGLRSDGLGLLITVSRAISRADNPKKVAEHIRQIINKYRSDGQSQYVSKIQVVHHPMPSIELSQIAEGLLDAGCIKFGNFTLKSGKISPIYIDLRQLVSFPKLLEHVARAYLPILTKLSFDRLAGLPYAALPITTAISIQAGWRMIYPRKETKLYGTKVEIEGIYNKGERIVIIDDLATTGESKFEAIEKLTSAGLKVKDVVVLIDRQSGAAEVLRNQGYTLHSVTTLSCLLDYYETQGLVSKNNIDAAREFLTKSL